MKIENKIKITEIAKLEHATPCVIPFPEDLVSAGFPSSAENFTENVLDLNDLLISHKAATFFIRVIGDSMIDAGINSNDILIVDRALSIAHNKIAVVRINSEFTVKRVLLKGHRMVLQAANNNYKPLEITPDMDVEIWGIVTFVIHQV